ncbi:MAG TPA: HAD family phosphatase [Caulobacteraceae bacterium]|nr:HAD family phosphatase [Caulobacteraceae bacterium]
MFPRPIRAVVFDLDGLLVDTETVIRDAMTAAATSLGGVLPEAVFLQMVGLPAATSDTIVRAHFGPGFPIDAFFAETDRRAHAIFDAEDLLKAGVLELIDHLDTEGLPRAIATSSSHHHVERMLAPRGVLARFDAVVARGDYPRGKPHPDPFLVAAARLNLAPEDCLALEDSHNGVRAAHAAGMMTVMVPDLLEPTEEMRGLCVAVVESLGKVRAALREREGSPAPRD